MTFKQLYDDISKKLRLTSEKWLSLIKDSINEQIIELCRMKEWKRLKNIYVLTLDDSDTYDLGVLLDNRCTILEIVSPETMSNISGTNNTLDKYDYRIYKGLDDKSNKYAIFGNTLYLIGASGDYDIIYTSYGGAAVLSITSFVAAGSIINVADSSKVSVGKYFYATGTASNNKKFTVASIVNTTQITVNETTVDETIAVSANVGPDFYPLAKPEDEVPALTYYWDILKQMVVIYMMESTGDIASIKIEEKRLNNKLTMLARNENREENSGKIHHIQR